MKISWRDGVNELCGNYFDYLADNLGKDKRMNRESRKIVSEFLHDIDSNYHGDCDFEGALMDYAVRHRLTDIALLFDGELKDAAVFLLGEEWAALLQRYMRLEAESPYTYGYSRRSMRCPLPEMHINNSLVLDIKALVKLKASGLSAAEILRGGRTPEQARDIEYELCITPWLAAKIDAGDRQCIDYLTDAMMSENNSNRVTNAHFKAIAMSGNSQLLDIEGKLLLAARLQEGLRQAIVETMDEGRPCSFVHILNVIKDNGLQRYAAVKRGLAVATGLGEIDAPERISDKFVDLALMYVTSAEARQAAIESNDAMEVYLGLWATAFYDVRDIEEPMRRLIDSAPAYRVEAAMLLLSATGSAAIKRRIVSEALQKRISDHGVMAGALPMYLTGFYVSWYGEPSPVPPLSKFFGSREEALRDCANLTTLLKSMKPKETFDPYVFPWIRMELTKGEVAQLIGKIALLLDSQKLMEAALDLVEWMEPYTRAGFIKYLLKDASSRKQIEYAVAAMTDRGTEAKEAACAIVTDLHKAGKLLPADYLALESHLRLKASSLRVAVISILSSLPDAEAKASVKRLLADKTADRRLAGLDIIKNWIDKGERPDLRMSLLPEVEAMQRPTSKEKVLIESILGSAGTGDPTYSTSNGYGLYDPDKEIGIKVTRPAGFNAAKALTFADPDKAKRLMIGIMEIIEKNADHEFTNNWGESCRLGNCVKQNKYGLKLEALAMPEVWKEFYEKEIGNAPDMLRLLLAASYTNPFDSPFFDTMERILGAAFHRKPMQFADTSLFPALKRLVSNALGRKAVDVSEMPYYSLAYEVCECLYQEYGEDAETYRICADVMSAVALDADKADLAHTYKRGAYRWEREASYPIYKVWPLRLLYEQLSNRWTSCADDLFIESFAARYEIYRKLGFNKDFNTVNAMEYLRLWREGHIADSDVWREMMGREASPSTVMALTSRLPEAPKRYARQPDFPRLNPKECALVNTAVERILDIELKRGDTPTVVSHLAKEIQVISGISHFIDILLGLGKDKPINNLYSAGDGKRAMFSRLLRASCPAKDDTAATLREMAAKAGITDERLVEAAMYSPRWLELVEEAIGWKGLTSAAYYFLAHTGEYLDDNVKSRISRYTSVAPEDFADGAFDTAWFDEVYRLLGKKRFEVVYDAAKYISEGNRHTRARKLSDAVLGILKVKDVTKDIVEKRNKDLVVALGLIPLGRNRIKDMRQRYAMLNTFLKESKQFGAQRQASEGRAVKLALDNLARTAGFGDATRMTWSLEADLVKEVAEYLSPKEIDGVTAYVSLTDSTPELVMESKGKRLQSIPARLKKDKYVERLREVHKQLKEQHVRGRALLEKAMVESAAFTGEEIGRLRENPIIWDMLSRLVMANDSGAFGFPGSDGASLVSAHGEETAIAPTDTLRIAHPYDMMEAGVWSDFQKAIFDRQWRQPFKQVFRELYVPTAEEAAMTQTTRYAGNQIMPSRAVAVLKKRQWIVDYENGLQKVCFHGDVTAVMYAMADWFSPSDIEAPTLEYVAFHDRRTFKDKKISEIMPIVFSEIMRDVDLAVSVAHAGGVDPETSHSTIEMRRAIVEHAMPMFGITNVTVAGNFAKVAGSLASYNIHLGSGVIHKEGGAQIAVLPVHSQSRGRIFLPFLDEDPKTAEIISKILLFAEDTKIKDPSILRQI